MLNVRTEKVEEWHNWISEAKQWIYYFLNVLLHYEQLLWLIFQVDRMEHIQFLCTTKDNISHLNHIPVKYIQYVYIYF